MPGNKQNVRRFNRIDVHIAALPATRAALESLLPSNYEAPLGSSFVRAGLIAPEGFTQARDESNQNVNAYGVDGLIESIDTFNFESWAAIFLEDNPTIRGLVYPGTTTTAKGSLVPVPVYDRVVTAFTLENTATGYGERWLTIGGSIWKVNGDRSTPDSDIRRTPLICTVLPLDPDDSENPGQGDELTEGGLYFKQASDDAEAEPEGDD